MIYLITGVPGSGKSLYAVGELLQQLMREVVKHEDGSEYRRRLCVDNIPHLLLDHALMAPGKLVAGLVEPTTDGDGLWNWSKWCKPGDVLVSDEVQRHWRPRGMGTKVPEQIAMLETHRHFGIDLVLITQNAMLLDQNVRRLVGRHMHVRRVFGGSRAIIYDWDGCQTDTTRTAGATKRLWSYPRNAFKLYKSSELHTKQRQKIPVWMAFPLVVLALGAFAGPKAYETMHGAVTGKGIAQAAPGPAKPSSAAAAPTQASGMAGAPAAVPAVPGANVSRPQAVGCITFADKCSCFDGGGLIVKLPIDECRDGSQRVGGVVPLALTRPAGGATVSAGPALDVAAVPAVAASMPQGAAQGRGPGGAVRADAKKPV